MMNDWPALRAILAQVPRLPATKGAPWVHWTLAAMMLLSAPFLVVASGGGRDLAHFVFGIAVVASALFWWVQLTMSIAVQATPAAVRLLPQFPQRARQLLIGAWLLASLLATAAVGLPLGYPAHVFVAAALVLVEIVLLRSKRHQWWVIALVLVMNFAPQEWRDTIVQAFLGDAVVLPGLIVMVLRGRQALAHLLGGQMPARTNAVARGALPAWVARASEMLRLPVHAATRLVRPHPFNDLPQTVGTLAAAAALPWLMGDAQPLLQTLRWTFLVMFAVKQPMLIQTLVAGGYQRLGEQGLVRLAAGSPGAAQLNRVLGRDLLVLGVIGWLWLALWQSALMFLLRASLAQTASVFAAASCWLPLYALILRDYARANGAQDVSKVYAAAMTVLWLFLAGWAAKNAWPPVVWAGLIAVNVALAMKIGQQRWRLMLAAPPAFPAGRLP